jgi:hypothetical protein
MSRHKNAGQNRSMNRADRSFENGAKIKYLGMILTNKNFIHEEIRSRL